MCYFIFAPLSIVMVPKYRKIVKNRVCVLIYIRICKGLLYVFWYNQKSIVCLKLKQNT